MDSLSSAAVALIPEGALHTAKQTVKTLDSKYVPLQLAVALSIGATALVLFSALRLRWPALYHPKSRALSYSPPKLRSSFFGWVIDLINIEEEKILDLMGLDALMALRFFKLSRSLFSVCAIYGMLVLLPLTLTADSAADLDQSASNDMFTVKVLIEKDGRLIAHCFGVYLFTLTSFYLFKREYQVFTRLRWSYLKADYSSISARSVIIQGVPEKHRQGEFLKSFLTFLKLGRIDSVSIYQHTPELPKLLDARLKVLLKIENYVTEWLHNPWVSDSCTTDDVRLSLERNSIFAVDNKKRPTIRTSLLGPRVDAISYHHQILNRIDNEIHQARNKFFSMSGLAFVTFKSIRSAHYASQLLLSSSLSKFRISLAPEPRDIVWCNLELSPTSLLLRNIAAWLSMLSVTILYIAAIVFVLYMNTQRAAQMHPEVSWSLARSCLEVFLPPVTLLAFAAATPYAFRMISKFQGAVSYSSIERHTASKYFAFLLFIVWFFFAGLSVGLEGDAARDYQSPVEFDELVKNLLGVSPFFINYVVILGMGYLPLKLLQLQTVLLFIARRIFCFTPREFAGLLAPVYVDYGRLFGQPMFIFVIVLTYSVFSPLILVFGVAYFFVGHLVLKYLLLYVLCRRYESGGLMWPLVFRRLMLGVFLLQAVMIGVFSFKKHFNFAIAILPLVGLSIWFCVYIARAYPADCRFLPADISCQDHDESEFLSVPSPGPNEGVHRSPASSRNSTSLPPDDIFDGFQSPMTRFSGVLDSSIVGYENPALCGELPSLWLPYAISSLRFHKLNRKRTCLCCFPVSMWTHPSCHSASPRPTSPRRSFSSHVEIPIPCPPPIHLNDEIN